MEISEKALEALKEEAYEEGYKKAREDMADDLKVYRAQRSRLMEILEVEGDQSLMDAAEHLADECRAHRNAAQTASMIIERQRKELTATKQYANEVYAAIEPKQEEIKQLQMENLNLKAKIDELRQALLHHVKETA
jgi:hypothetical protein